MAEGLWDIFSMTSNVLKRGSGGKSVDGVLRHGKKSKG
jgi:hypothetical protein